MGFAAGGVCELGVCPPTQPESNGTNVTVPFDFTTTANGDSYRVAGSMQDSTAGVNTPFSVQLLYAGGGGALAHDDTLVFTGYTDWTCNLPPGTTGIATQFIYGTFGSGLGGSSRVQYSGQMGTFTASLGPFAPPNAYEQSIDGQTACAGSISYTWTLQVTFGAGSPVGAAMMVLGAPPPSPLACSPRPAIGLSVVSNGQGGLTVTVGESGSGVYLESLQFGTSLNGLIDVPGRAPGSTGNFSAFVGAVPVTSFTIRQASAGQGTTVPFTVVDDCGSWPTFAGGGAHAFAAPHAAGAETTQRTAVNVAPLPTPTLTPTPMPTAAPQPMPAPAPSGPAPRPMPQAMVQPLPTRRAPLASVSTEPSSPAPTAAPSPPPAAPPLSQTAPTATMQVPASDGPVFETVIDPLDGGRLSTADGAVAFALPAGATRAPVLVGLQSLSSTSTMVELTAQEDAGQEVSGFALSSTVTVEPSPNDLQAVGGDASGLVLGTWDALNGAWQALPTTFNADGTLSAEVSVPGTLAVLPAQAD